MNPRVTTMSYVLAVPDLEASKRWWAEVMGFRLNQDVDGWAFMSLDRFGLHLGECPDAIPVQDMGDHQYFAYVEMEEIDSYYTAIRARGAEILKAPVDEPWGMREMAIRTPDGHRMMIAKAL